MTVKALKELLNQYPGNLRVVVDGYEDGYDDLAQECISVRKIQLNTKTKDWEGQHSDFDSLNQAEAEAAEAVEALVFRRASY
ncbi:MAG: hypothetical protein OXT74_05660 [Candidatus Poribacteria bacterium]|nr:hypothetical protein [Candidatus Poribacteria bacterium]